MKLGAYLLMKLKTYLLMKLELLEIKTQTKRCFHSFASLKWKSIDPNKRIL